MFLVCAARHWVCAVCRCQCLYRPAAPGSKCRVLYKLSATSAACVDTEPMLARQSCNKHAGAHSGGHPVAACSRQTHVCYGPLSTSMLVQTPGTVTLLHLLYMESVLASFLVMHVGASHHDSCVMVATCEVTQRHGMLVPMAQSVRQYTLAPSGHAVCKSQATKLVSQLWAVR